MKIASVRSFLLSYPFAEPIRLPFYGGERTILKRDAMFIRVEADNGLVGYAPGPGSEPAHHAIAAHHRAFSHRPHSGRPRRPAGPVLRGHRRQPRVRQDLLLCGDRTIRPGRQGPRRCPSPNCSAAGCATASASMAAPECTCRPKPMPPRPRPSPPWDSRLTRCGPPSVPRATSRRTPHARGRRPRFRPHGGRPYLVAHGRPQL